MCFWSKTRAKVLLVIANYAILAMGCAIVAIGSTTKNNSDQMLDILDYIPESQVEQIGGKTEVAALLDQAATIVIACGSGIICIALVGCLGAYLESALLLSLYIVVGTLLALVQIAPVVMAVQYSHKVFDTLEPYLNITLSVMYDGGDFDNDGNYVKNDNAIALVWDMTMVVYQCCGRMNYMDFQLYAGRWKGNVDVNDTSVVPLACCKTKGSTRYNFPKKVEFVNSADCLMRASAESTNHKGCYRKLLDDVTKYKDSVLHACVGMISVQLIAVLAAAVLIYFRNHQGWNQDHTLLNQGKDEEQGQNKDKGQSQDKDKGQSQDKDKAQGQSQDQGQHKDQGQSQDKDQGQSQDKDQGQFQDKDQSQEKDNGQDKDQGQNKDKDQGQGQDKDQGQNKDKDQDQGQGQDKDQGQNKDKDQGQNKDKDQGQGQDKDKSQGEDQDA